MEANLPTMQGSRVHTPADKKFGFVLKGISGATLEDYLIAVGDIVNDLNITDAGRLRGNFSIFVKNEEAAEKLRECEVVTVKSQSVAIWPYLKPSKAD